MHAPALGLTCKLRAAARSDDQRSCPTNSLDEATKLNGPLPRWTRIPAIVLVRNCVSLIVRTRVAWHLGSVSSGSWETLSWSDPRSPTQTQRCGALTALRHRGNRVRKVKNYPCLVCPRSSAASLPILPAPGKLSCVRGRLSGLLRGLPRRTQRRPRTTARAGRKQWRIRPPSRS